MSYEQSNDNEILNFNLDDYLLFTLEPERKRLMNDENLPFCDLKLKNSGILIENAISPLSPKDDFFSFTSQLNSLDVPIKYKTPPLFYYQDLVCCSSQFDRCEIQAKYKIPNLYCYELVSSLQVDCLKKSNISQPPKDLEPAEDQKTKNQIIKSIRRWKAEQIKMKKSEGPKKTSKGKKKIIRKKSRRKYNKVCCINGCKKTSSNRMVHSLKTGLFKRKRNFQGIRICSQHYFKDLHKFKTKK